jgi:hypothetical protein
MIRFRHLRSTSIRFGSTPHGPYNIEAPGSCVMKCSLGAFLVIQRLQTPLSWVFVFVRWRQFESFRGKLLHNQFPRQAADASQFHFLTRRCSSLLRFACKQYAGSMGAVLNMYGLEKSCFLDDRPERNIITQNSVQGFGAFQ